MIFHTCAFEKELRQALKDGHWPAACAPELRQHVRTCARCNDLVLVAEAFQGARAQSVHPVEMTPDMLWWRAQLRRRRTANERVTKPVNVAQIFAWAISLVAAIVFAASQYNQGLHWATWWTEISPVHLVRFSLIATTGVNWNLVLVIPTLGALALLGGVLVYLVSEKS